MNVVVEWYTLRTLDFAGAFVPALVHTVDDEAREICERVVRLLRIEASPVADNVFPRTLPAVFPVHRVVVVLFRWDVLNHQLEHLNSLRCQFITFFWLENLFQKIRVRHIEFSLFVDLDTLNRLNLTTVYIRQILIVEVLHHHLILLIVVFHYVVKWYWIFLKETEVPYLYYWKSLKKFNFLEISG